MMENLNPLLWLELRVRVRERRLWMVAVFFVGTLAVISGVTLAAHWAERDSLQPAEAGDAIVWSTLFCHLGLLAVIAPLATAGRIAQEREQRTLAALANSPLGRARIAWGKLLGAWVFVLWLSPLALPFLLAGALWGGPPLVNIAGCLVLNTLAGFTLAAVALGVSGLFGRSLTAYIVTGLFLFGWMGVVPLLGTLALSVRTEAGSAYMQGVAYLAWHHHPFVRLAALVDTDWNLHATSMLLQLGYALSLWFALAALSLWLAVKSLRREVY